MDKVNEKLKTEISFSCPFPFQNYEKILLAHGSGGSLSSQLLEKMLLPFFDNEYSRNRHDGAVIVLENMRIAFTADSYVVDPIFFPGGDIGKLAVYGTVNDLAVCGAKPLFISLSLIIEEGLPTRTLERVLNSVRIAAQEADVKIITGDTKVVQRGKADKIFINTSGIGRLFDNANISPYNCRPGDVIILSGSIAEHGIAVMTEREGLKFEKPLVSDCNHLDGLVGDILRIPSGVNMMRDPTRGGIASSLNEIASSSGLGINIAEAKVLINEEVRGVCELLGFDPMYVANEGKLLIIADKSVARSVLDIVRSHPLGRNADVIGEVVLDHPGIVVMETGLGSRRVLDMLSGEQLPRIC